MEAPRRSATCPSRVEGAPAVITGPDAILVGGATVADGTVLASSLRANTAPQSPFFQLGLVGATVPGLKIEGEIGQQLGYLNAAGVGTVNFIILLLIGWAFAHKAQTRAIIGRLLHRAAAASRRRRVRSGAGRSPSPGSTAPRRTGKPARSQASIPPATLTTSVRPAPDQEAGHGRGPAAHVADDHQRPVGRAARRRGS